MTATIAEPAVCPHATAAIGSGYDPFEPGFCDNPYPIYDLARREAPVAYNPKYNLWIVTGREEVLAVLKDTEHFSSLHNLDPSIPWEPEVCAALGRYYPTAPGLFNSDPPMHDHIRALFAASFTPRRIALLEPRIREIVNSLIDNFIADGQANILDQFAYPLPMTVITDLMGVPREDIPKVKAWNDHWLSMLNPASLEQMLIAARESVEYQEYYTTLIEDRRANPRDDLITALVEARIDGVGFTLEEMISQLLVLLVAGHETTMTLICNMVLLLLQHPDQLAAVKADHSLIPMVTEEALRVETPTQMLPRVTTGPVELGGVELPAGARLHVMFGAANRDPNYVEAPERFDIHRESPVQHLAFGRGIHFCIGAPLARLEARVALETLLDRLPNMRFAPDFELAYRPHFFQRTCTHLPVQWDVA